MITLGLHKNNGKLKEFAANSEAPDYFADALIEAMSSEFANTFGLEFVTIVQAEFSSGITPTVEGHPGNWSCTNSASLLYISNRYAFAQHKDTRDNSMTCLLWTNKDNIIHKHQKYDSPYLVLGNMEIEIEDKVYNGLAIKLFHGIMITALC